MCQHHSYPNPVRCIIPPYMNSKLINSSDEALAQRAMQSHLQALALRARRQFLCEQPVAKKATKRSVKKTTMAMDVYDIHHSTDVAKANLLWQDGKIIKTLDQDARNVVKAGKGTWDFYYSVYGRNSVDNAGLRLKHYVHYGHTEEDMDNAMWDGQEMVYGDGDGTVFGSFTSDIDIIGHELTHSVTQYESNLNYENQSGALNESLSDVFGIMIKQKMMNLDTKKSNWLIGENVLLGNNYSLRSMKAPGTAYVNHPDLGTDPQPATMDHFVHMPNTASGDNGGVHYNSGITNFAFYVTAFNIGGNAWEKAGRIWYAAMTDASLKANAQFADFKNLTIKKATALFGAGSKEEKATKDGWKAAKV